MANNKLSTFNKKNYNSTDNALENLSKINQEIETLVENLKNAYTAIKQIDDISSNNDVLKVYNSNNVKKLTNDNISIDNIFKIDTKKLRNIAPDDKEFQNKVREAITKLNTQLKELKNKKKLIEKELNTKINSKTQNNKLPSEFDLISKSLDNFNSNDINIEPTVLKQVNRIVSTSDKFQRFSDEFISIFKKISGQDKKISKNQIEEVQTTIKTLKEKLKNDVNDKNFNNSAKILENLKSDNNIESSTNIKFFNKIKIASKQLELYLHRNENNFVDILDKAGYFNEVLQTSANELSVEANKAEEKTKEALNGVNQSPSNNGSNTKTPDPSKLEQQANVLQNNIEKSGENAENIIENAGETIKQVKKTAKDVKKATEEQTLTFEDKIDNLLQTKKKEPRKAFTKQPQVDEFKQKINEFIKDKSIEDNIKQELQSINTDFEQLVNSIKGQSDWVRNLSKKVFDDTDKNSIKSRLIALRNRNTSIKQQIQPSSSGMPQPNPLPTPQNPTQKLSEIPISNRLQGLINELFPLLKDNIDKSKIAEVINKTGYTEQEIMDTLKYNLNDEIKLFMNNQELTSDVIGKWKQITTLEDMVHAFEKYINFGNKYTQHDIREIQSSSQSKLNLIDKFQTMISSKSNRSGVDIEAILKSMGLDKTYLDKQNILSQDQRDWLSNNALYNPENNYMDAGQTLKAKLEIVSQTIDDKFKTISDILNAVNMAILDAQEKANKIKTENKAVKDIVDSGKLENDLRSMIFGTEYKGIKIDELMKYTSSISLSNIQDINYKLSKIRSMNLSNEQLSMALKGINEGRLPLIHNGQFVTNGGYSPFKGYDEIKSALDEALKKYNKVIDSQDKQRNQTNKLLEQIEKNAIKQLEQEEKQSYKSKMDNFNKSFFHLFKPNTDLDMSMIRGGGLGKYKELSKAINWEGFFNMGNAKKFFLNAFGSFKSFLGSALRGVESAFRKVWSIVAKVSKSIVVSVTGAVASVTAAITGFVATFTMMGKSILTATDEYRRQTIAIAGVYQSASKTNQMINMTYGITKGMPIDYTKATQTLSELSAIPALQQILRSPDVSKAEQLLSKMFKVISAMTTMRPDQTSADAIFSLRNAFAGDLRSLAKRFDLPVNNIMNTKGTMGLASVKSDPLMMLDSLEQYFDSFLDIETVNKISDTIGVIIEKIKGAFDLFKSNIGTSGFYDLVIKDFRKIRDYVTNLITSDEGKALAKRISDIFSNVYVSAQSIFVKIKDGILNAFNIQAESFPDMFTKILETFAKTVKYIDGLIDGNKISDFIKDTKTKITEFVKTVETYIEKLKPTINNIIDDINKAVNYVTDKIKGLIDIFDEYKLNKKGLLYIMLLGPGNSLNMLTSGLSTVTNVVTGLGIALGTLVLNAKMLKVALAPILATFGKALVVVGALTFAIMEIGINWEKIQERIANTSDWIVNKFQRFKYFLKTFRSFIVDLFVDTFAVIRDLMIGFGDALTENLSLNPTEGFGIGKAIKSFFTNSFDAIWGKQEYFTNTKRYLAEWEKSSKERDESYKLQKQANREKYNPTGKDWTLWNADRFFGYDTSLKGFFADFWGLLFGYEDENKEQKEKNTNKTTSVVEKLINSISNPKIKKNVSETYETLSNFFEGGFSGVLKNIKKSVKSFKDSVIGVVLDTFNPDKQKDNYDKQIQTLTNRMNQIISTRDKDWNDLNVSEKFDKMFEFENGNKYGLLGIDALEHEYAQTIVAFDNIIKNANMTLKAFPDDIDQTVFNQRSQDFSEALNKMTEQIRNTVLKSVDIIFDEFSTKDFKYISNDIPAYVKSKTRTMEKELYSEILTDLQLQYSFYFATNDNFNKFIDKNIQKYYNDRNAMLQAMYNGEVDMSELNDVEKEIADEMVKRYNAEHAYYENITKQRMYIETMNNSISKMSLSKLSANWEEYMNSPFKKVRDAAGNRYNDILNEGSEFESIENAIRKTRDIAINSFTTLQEAYIEATRNTINTVNSIFKEGLTKLVTEGGTVKNMFKEAKKTLYGNILGVHTGQIANELTKFLFGTVQKDEKQSRDDIISSIDMDIKTADDNIVNKLNDFMIQSNKRVDDIINAIYNTNSKYFAEVLSANGGNVQSTIEQINNSKAKEIFNGEKYTSNGWKVTGYKGLDNTFKHAIPNPKKDTAIKNINPELAQYETVIQHAAKTYDVDPLLIKSVMLTESNADYENSKKPNRAKAQGLMQVTPQALKEVERVYGIKYELGEHLGKEKNVYNNTMAGSAYLKWLLKAFNNDYTLATTAYNAGIGKVKGAGGLTDKLNNWQNQQYALVVYRFYNELEKQANKNGTLKTNSINASFSEQSNEAKRIAEMLATNGEQVAKMFDGRNSCAMGVRATLDTIVDKKAYQRFINETRPSDKSYKEYYGASTGFGGKREFGLPNVSHAYTFFNDIPNSPNFDTIRLSVDNLEFKDLEKILKRGDILTWGQNPKNQHIGIYGGEGLLYSDHVENEYGKNHWFDKRKNNGYGDIQISRFKGFEQETGDSLDDSLKNIQDDVHSIATNKSESILRYNSNIKNSLKPSNIKNSLKPSNIEINQDNNVIEKFEITELGKDSIGSAISLASGINNLGSIVSNPLSLMNADSFKHIPTPLKGIFKDWFGTVENVENKFKGASIGSYFGNMMAGKGGWDSLLSKNVLGGDAFNLIQGENKLSQRLTGVTSLLFGRNAAKKLATKLTGTKLLGTTLSKSLPVIGTVVGVLSQKGWLGGAKDRTAEGRARYDEYNAYRSSLVKKRYDTASQYYMSDMSDLILDYQFGGINSWTQKRGKWYKGTKRKVMNTDATDFVESMKDYWDLILEAAKDQLNKQRALNKLQSINQEEYIKKSYEYAGKQLDMQRHELADWKKLLDNFKGTNATYTYTDSEGFSYTFQDVNDEIEKLTNSIAESEDKFNDLAEQMEEYRKAFAGVYDDYILKAMYGDSDVARNQMSIDQIRREYDGFMSEGGEAGSKEWIEYQIRLIDAQKDLTNAIKQLHSDYTNQMHDVVSSTHVKNLKAEDLKKASNYASAIENIKGMTFDKNAYKTIDTASGSYFTRSGITNANSAYRNQLQNILNQAGLDISVDDYLQATETGIQLFKQSSPISVVGGKDQSLQNALTSKGYGELLYQINPNPRMDRLGKKEYSTLIKTVNTASLTGNVRYITRSQYDALKNNFLENKVNESLSNINYVNGYASVNGRQDPYLAYWLLNNATDRRGRKLRTFWNGYGRMNNIKLDYNSLKSDLKNYSYENLFSIDSSDLSNDYIAPYGRGQYQKVNSTTLGALFESYGYKGELTREQYYEALRRVLGNLEGGAYTLPSTDFSQYARETMRMWDNVIVAEKDGLGQLVGLTAEKMEELIEEIQYAISRQNDEYDYAITELKTNLNNQLEASFGSLKSNRTTSVLEPLTDYVNGLAALFTYINEDTNLTTKEDKREFLYKDAKGYLEQIGNYLENYSSGIRNMFDTGLFSMANLEDALFLSYGKNLIKSFYEQTQTIKNEILESAEKGKQANISNAIEDLQDNFVKSIESWYDYAADIMNKDTMRNAVLSSISGFDDFKIANSAREMFNNAITGLSYGKQNTIESLMGIGNGEFGTDSLSTMLGISSADLQRQDPYELYYEYEKSKILNRIENAEEESDEAMQAYADLWNIMKENAEYLKRKADETTESIEKMLDRIEETARTRVSEEAKTQKGDIIFFDLGSSRTMDKTIQEMINKIKTNDPDAQNLVQQLKNKLLNIKR